jgi:hypothetical protein
MVQLDQDRRNPAESDRNRESSSSAVESDYSAEPTSAK